MSRPTKHYNGWRVRWLDENGKRQSAVYETPEEAAFQLQRRRLEVEERRLGLRVAATAPKPFNAIADYWQTNRTPLKRSGKNDLSILKQLRAEFGELSLAKPVEWIPAIDRYAAARSHLNKKTLANHLTLLGTMLRLAVDLEWMPKLPRIRKPKVRAINQDFSYLRTDEEITRFLTAAKAKGEMVFVLYAMAIYTGMRAGELAGTRWDDVDLDQRLIVVQRSYGGPTKADDVRYVPVLDALLPILRGWRLKHPGKLVFTNRDGNMLQRSDRIFQEVLHVVLSTAGFPKVERSGKERHYVRFHDLRHTFASTWVRNAGDLFKLQKILGHKTVQMTMRYAHLQPTAFKDDLGRFGAGHLRTDGQVVEMSRQTVPSPEPGRQASAAI